MGVMRVRRHPAGPVPVKLLTCCQGNRTTVRERTVRRLTARSDMKSLTSCQATRTKVGVRAVTRHPAGPGMKSLTSCQANRTSM